MCDGHPASPCSSPPCLERETIYPDSWHTQPNKSMSKNQFSTQSTPAGSHSANSFILKKSCPITRVKKKWMGSTWVNHRTLRRSLRKIKPREFRKSGAFSAGVQLPTPTISISISVLYMHHLMVTLTSLNIRQMA